MKRLLFLLILSPLFAADPPGLVVWKGSDLPGVEKTLAEKLDERKSAAEELSKSGNGRVLVVHREADGEAEVDETSSRLFIMESGNATLVVGGQLVHLEAAGTGEIRAASIDGGTRVLLVAGDVALVPTDVPHQLLISAGERATYLEIEQASSDADDASVPQAPWTGPKPELGADMGAGFRACVPGDNSPGGTIVDGYKKMTSRSFVGASCLWARLPSNDAVATGNPTSPATARVPPQLGKDMGDGYRACVAGDDSPSGTVLDGYRKLSHSSPFGVSCGWEKIK
jgi:hypothetical protein